MTQVHLIFETDEEVTPTLFARSVARKMVGVLRDGERIVVANTGTSFKMTEDGSQVTQYIDDAPVGDILITPETLKEIFG